MPKQERKFGLLSRKVILGTTLGVALFFMVIGVIFWGGFNTAMEATNTLTFCISCHEMEENVFREYQQTAHYTNRSGVRATCSDCHVPDPWVHKVVRKVQASNELVHKVLGTIDTPEKFDQRRLKMAKKVWTTMKETDSRECRNCHDFASMNPENQKNRARKQHINAMQSGNTCIDCHKGIVHHKVHDQLADVDLEDLERPDPANIRPLPPQWVAFLEAEAGEPEEPADLSTEPANVPETESDATAVSDTAGAVDTPVQEETADTAVESAVEPSESSVIPAATTPTVADPAAGGDSDIDWAAIEPMEIRLFYPGQTSMEWVLTGSDHGGKRVFLKGERCFGCHEDEEEDIGDLIVVGDKDDVEPAVIPDKRGSIPLSIQAAHDNEYLYMRFQWPDTEHVPVPFVDGGKMDPDNPSKLALMIAADAEENPPVEFAERAGCWQTCHHDANDMPHQPDQSTLADHPLAGRLDLENGFTKYLQESRSEIEIEGKGDKLRGGWDKLKGEDELQAAFDSGVFMDLLRYQTGTGLSEDGHVFAERVMEGGQGVTFTGGLEGEVWTVEMKRRLASDHPGDISLSTDQWYNIGVAIHDDYSSSRFHHVSLGLKLAFDDEDAEINVIGL